MNYEIDVEEDSLSVDLEDHIEQDKYSRKYELLNKKCIAIQKENQMMVLRLLKTKKRILRLRKERKFLIDELDQRNDDFRNIPLTLAIDDDEPYQEQKP